MEVLKNLSDLFLHLDKHLVEIIRQYGTLAYLLLFMVIFLETGLVVTPFLPGDSLLFIAGTISATGAMNILVLYALFAFAAILGDTLNYWIGHTIGPKVFQRENSKIFKPEYLAKTHSFYEKYGGKTIILARFIPIVRTFAPFVAGVGKMHYGQFISYNIIGGLVWTALFTFGGYFFGNLPIVKEHFHEVVLGIIVLSVVPVLYELYKHKRMPKSEEKVSLGSIEKTFQKQHLTD